MTMTNSQIKVLAVHQEGSLFGSKLEVMRLLLASPVTSDTAG